MSTKLHKFMRNVHNAHPLTLATANVVPGTLLETRWSGSRNPIFSREEGAAWDILSDVNEADYPSRMHDANILVGTISEKLSLGVDLSIAPFGINIGAEFSKEHQATINIGTIRARVFDVGFSGHELRKKLRELRKSDSERWKWVDDDFLVTECFFTGDMEFNFRSSGDLSAKLGFEHSGGSVDASLTAIWANDQHLILRGTASVPFAVRGMKI